MKNAVFQKRPLIYSYWLKEAKAVSHILGFGLQRHANGGQNIRAIEALAAVHGDIGKNGGGIFLGSNENQLFNNQQLYDSAGGASSVLNLMK